MKDDVSNVLTLPVNDLEAIIVRARVVAGIKYKVYQVKVTGTFYSYLLIYGDVVGPTTLSGISTNHTAESPILERWVLSSARQGHAPLRSSEEYSPRKKFCPERSSLRAFSERESENRPRRRIGVATCLRV